MYSHNKFDCLIWHPRVIFLEFVFCAWMRIANTLRMSTTEAVPGAPPPGVLSEPRLSAAHSNNTGQTNWSLEAKHTWERYGSHSMYTA